MWYEIKVKTTSEASEAVSNMLYEIGAEGVLIEDPNDPVYTNSKESDWDYIDIEEVKRHLEYEGAVVKCYFDGADVASSDIQDKIAHLKGRLAQIESFGLEGGPLSVELKELENTDWNSEWKKHYKPFEVGNKLVIKPSWEDYSETNDRLIIEIDPGGAFGSGTHETTSMCMEMLEENVTPDVDVFDIGCGSGILGIAAAKLGAKSVVAVDLDEAAVMTSKENAERNKVDSRFDVRHGNLMDVVQGQADIVVANIIADIIILLSKDVKTFMKPGGLFISSGIIDTKVDDVVNGLEASGFEIVEVRRRGEWAAILSR